MYWHACTVPFLFIIFFGRTCSSCSSCSSQQTQQSETQQNSETKLFWKYPFWKNMKKSEIKPINPLNGSTHPPPPINPSTTTKFRSTHQTHLSINPSTTTKFPNQETKTLFLYKTKLHGRKREEAPPHAYRKEREREREMSTRNGVK